MTQGIYSIFFLRLSFFHGAIFNHYGNRTCHLKVLQLTVLSSLFYDAIACDNIVTTVPDFVMGVGGKTSMGGGPRLL